MVRREHALQSVAEAGADLELAPEAPARAGVEPAPGRAGADAGDDAPEEADVGPGARRVDVVLVPGGDGGRLEGDQRGRIRDRIGRHRRQALRLAEVEVLELALLLGGEARRRRRPPLGGPGQLGQAAADDGARHLRSWSVMWASPCPAKRSPPQVLEVSPWTQ